MEAILVILAAQMVMLFFKHQEGIRLNSGAVPAAVNSEEFLHFLPLSHVFGMGRPQK